MPLKPVSFPRPSAPSVKRLQKPTVAAPVATASRSASSAFVKGASSVASGVSDAASKLGSFLAGSEGVTTASKLRQLSKTMVDPAASKDEADSAKGLFGNITRVLRDLTEANKLQEVAELAKLPEDQRAAYLALRKELDPVGRASLQKLLFDGALSPELLQSLTQLSGQALAPGIDRQQLLSDTISDVASPGSSQQEGNTCAAESIATNLAIENPVEFVRLVAGLASTVSAALVAGLLVPALMNAAVEGRGELQWDVDAGHYVNAEGEPVGVDGAVVSEEQALSQLPGRWVTELLSQVRGDDYRLLNVGFDPALQQAAGALLQVAATEDPPVPMMVVVDGSLFGTDGAHTVNVVGMSEDGSHYLVSDPSRSGETVPVPVEQLDGALEAVHFGDTQLPEKAVERLLGEWQSAYGDLSLLERLMVAFDPVLSGGKRNRGGDGGFG